jgi:hypothetical protein
VEEEENAVEKAHEDLHEHAEHAREPWIGRVALTAALLAGIAALASSLSGHHESEGILEQIKASDHWSYYQAKGIKADILKALKPESPDIHRYAEEQKEIRVEATKAQESSHAHMQVHQIFAIAAITVLVRRPAFWAVSLVFGVIGFAFLARGLWLTYHLRDLMG